MSSERSEKRQLSRFRVMDFHATSSVIDIVLRDLNSEGMSIETRHPLRVGGSYPFRIRRRRQSAAIDGVVRWCKLLRMIDIGGGESQALYRAGIAFTQRLEDCLQDLWIDSQAHAESESHDPAAAGVLLPEERSAVSCPDCKLPAVVGAERCRICGTILPQS